MALISEEDIAKVKEANDFVQIASECVPDLKQKGGKFIACCPFHKEKTPSFQIDPEKQLFHCFGCHEGGDLVSFVEKIYNINFYEAIEFLADKANIQLKKVNGKTFSKSEKGKLTDACKLAAEFYHNQLMKVKNAGSNAARSYLGSRGMGSEVSKKWMLGYAPGKNELTKYLLGKKFSQKDLVDCNLCIVGKDGYLHDRFFNRVMFPICDINGNPIAFGGRIIDDGQPKYLNSSENVLFHKSSVMYGLEKAKNNMTASGTAIVVEGYTDVIALHESGINYAVATLGTALTRQHIRILNQHAKQKIVYLFDGDEAGQRAAERALNFIDQIERPEIYNKRAQLVALTLPDNLDPKEFIDKYGPGELLKLINNAKPLLQYGIERKINLYDLSIPGNKSKAATAALKVLAPIKESLLAKEYCSMIAEKTGMRVEDLIDELSKISKPTEYEQDSPQIINNVEHSDSPITKLENELLCVFAKHPDKIIGIIGDNFDYQWTIDSHKKLFDYIFTTVKENPSIKANDLVLKIHQKNAKTANMLTSISKMYDIKEDPQKHARYILLLLKAEQVSSDILTFKMEFNNLSDEKKKNDIYKTISKLQKQKTEYKKLANEMI